MIAENIRSVEQRIQAACARAGRRRDEVTLICVTKTMPVTDLQEAYDEGQRNFGENRVQEITEKYPLLPDDIRWHMIGHLQRNKVKYIAGYIDMIHSVDSLALAETISKEAAKHDRVIPILLEVNIAGEDTKFGLSPEEVPAMAEAISHLPNVVLRGFMTSAPFVDDPEENRVHFRKLAHLSVDSTSKNHDNNMVDVLSMGMSNDYKVAVEEGATMVRVGTSIFGARDYTNHG